MALCSSLLPSKKFLLRISSLRILFTTSYSEFHSLTRRAAATSPTNSRLQNRPEQNSGKVNYFIRPFSSNFKTNFILPSDSESDNEAEGRTSKPAPKEIDNNQQAKLPPPYDPFNKTPAVEDPKDPKNLQEIFHNMRSDGLMQSAVKMFDGLSKQGLTHEALQLFSQINKNGTMPDVIGHTAVIEAYSNAGQIKEAHKVYLRMLAAGVMPNAYTYSVLIKGLSKDKKKLSDARKYILEMMCKGIRPNAETYASLVEGFVREGMESECRSLVEEMKSRGYVADEKDVREGLSSNRGPVFRAVMSICFGR